MPPPATAMESVTRMLVENRLTRFSLDYLIVSFLLMAFTTFFSQLRDHSRDRKPRQKEANMKTVMNSFE
ncbi:hypothetical protein DY000_02058190 [Brassica cretica]|uniref:Uncharacterized protein n=1 Tax=Brassica cretica TaxID=69181 RepID=A0ABQ7AI26_BRACR|nr:hypothetical protein DY000_02058190 [Brassica cretica]